MSDGDNSIPSALHISVTPAQAAFFAGEPLTVTITITNTNTGAVSYDTPLAPTPNTPYTASPNPAHGRSHSASLASARHSHKRSTHSVSSVPMAHPPTSPGMGQIRHTPSNSLTGSASASASTSRVQIEDVREIRRGGLIGKGIRSGKIVNGTNGDATGKGKERELSVEVVKARSHLAADGKNAIFRGVRDEARFAGALFCLIRRIWFWISMRIQLLRLLVFLHPSPAQQLCLRRIHTHARCRRSTVANPRQALNQHPPQPLQPPLLASMPLWTPLLNHQIRHTGHTFLVQGTRPIHPPCPHLCPTNMLPPIICEHRARHPFTQIHPLLRARHPFLKEGMLVVIIARIQQHRLL